MFRIAIESGRPEPYGRNSMYAYNMLGKPLELAEEMAINDRLPTDEKERLAVLKQLLVDANERANEVMLGEISPEDRRKRDITATIVLGCIVVGFGVVFWKISRIFTAPDDGLPGKQARWAFRKYAWAYVLLLPAVITIVVWKYVPLARGSIMAFQDYQLMGQSSWVFVRNFADVLWDNLWWQALWNSLRYCFLICTLTFLPPIILAILLQEVPRGRLMFRTLYYLPAVITGLVTMLMWKQFFEPSEHGALNSILLQIPAIGFLAVGAVLMGGVVLFASRLWYHGAHMIGWGFMFAGAMIMTTAFMLAMPILFPSAETFGESVPHLLSRLFQATTEAHRWLEDPDTAMLSCVIPMIWAGMGPGCLIYLAALKGIPEELYEAADVDGATFIDKILFVVFPILKPLIIINFVGVFIGSWYGATGRILAMTAGRHKTEVAGLHIFKKAFTFLQFGPATAMAWMLAFMLIGFTVHQLRILSRLEFRTTGDTK